MNKITLGDDSLLLANMHNVFVNIWESSRYITMFVSLLIIWNLDSVRRKNSKTTIFEKVIYCLAMFGLLCFIIGWLAVNYG